MSAQLTPYEAVLLSFSYAERIESDEQIAARACLERAVEQAPGYSDAWAMLAMLFCDAYALGANAESSLVERALEAARRATKAAPSNHLAYHNLAYAHFIRKEFAACKNAAERALELNSMDSSSLWFMGLLIAYMGDWERGCELTERAMQLNPNHPGKYRYPSAFNLYRKGDYRGALNAAMKINMPEVFYTPLLIAAASAQFGEVDAAADALHDLLGLVPDFAAIAGENLGKWFQAELVEHLIEGLGKAGLEIPAANASPALTTSTIRAVRSASGASRADVRENEGFWVAVLPFRGASGDADLEALDDGMSEDITTGLARFPYLQVIAHNSAMAYKGRTADIRTVGRELGARYVMNGNLRQVGGRLRVSVQLVDAATGAQ